MPLRDRKKDMLDQDGCGILQYASGRAVVMVNRVNGGKYYCFYDDTPSGQVLAAFNFAGIGSATYVGSGAPRFIATKLGGSVLKEDGNLEKQWSWEKRGKPADLQHAIVLNLNPVIQLRCKNRSSIEISVKTHNQTFQVGQPKSRGDTYLDRVQRKRVDGSLVLDIPTPTLIERQTAAGAQPAAEAFKLAQEKNWSLPRLSASGRETDSVQVGPSLVDLVQTNRALVKTLKDHRSIIGRNILAQEEHLREVWEGKVKFNRSALDAVAKISVASARVPRSKREGEKLQRIHPSKLDRRVQNLKGTELLVVLCSTMGTTDCICAEKMMAKVENEWRRQKDQSKSIILADCSSCKLLGTRHNFTVYPMCLMYFGQHLAFCCNTYNGFGVAQEDFSQQIKITLRKCQNGQFLPSDFKF